MQTSRQFKYVITHNFTPILFNEAMKHSDFSDHEPISAGFCRVIPRLKEHNNVEIEVKCYGESVSLKLKPAPMDESLIQRMLAETY